MSIQEEVLLKVKHMAGKHPQKTHGRRGSGSSSGGGLPKPEPGKDYVRLDPSKYGISKSVADDNMVNGYEIDQAQNHAGFKKVGKAVMDNAKRAGLDITEREANVVGAKYRYLDTWYSSGDDNVVKFIRDQVRALSQGD